MSPSGSLSCPTTWGICFRIRMTPMAASNPLITLDGQKLPRTPARTIPRQIWISPANNRASKKASNVPRSLICRATIAVNPAAGPLTLVCEPLKSPITIPPIIPDKIPAKGGASEARAIPRQRGSATRKTTVPALKSREIVTMLNFDMVGS